jgi:hypothetical protein
MSQRPHRGLQDDALEPPADLDDIFYQIDQEIAFVEKELASYGGDLDKNSRPFPHRQVDALLRLKQFPMLFRASFKELVPRLPISIALRSRNMELGVPMTSPVDMPSTHYARFRCVFAPAPCASTDSPQCETWTFIPYTTDMFLGGLARILGVAANTRIEGDELEEELAAGFKLMFCSAHEEKLKDERALAFALASRPIVETWRGNVQLWWSLGMVRSRQVRASG